MRPKLLSLLVLCAMLAASQTAQAQCGNCVALMQEAAAIQEHIESTEQAIVDLEAEIHGYQLDIVALLQVPESQRGSWWDAAMLDVYFSWEDANSKLDTENAILYQLGLDLENVEKDISECGC